MEAAIPDDCIFATNTSTLPITSLAESFTRKEDFIGIHFFSPVHKMMLVEIIKGAETGDRATAKALDFVRQIRKTPIVVNDARFFYANRCIIPYLNEGMRMVSEGVDPALVENAAKQLGMPLGPLQLADETSIDLGVKIAKATKAALGNDYPFEESDKVLFKLFEEERMGRKVGAGFYEYTDKGKRGDLWDGLRANWPASDDQPDFGDVKNRLALAQALEAVRALEEGVLEDIREGDVGAILGWGFMPWSGGPLSWLDMLGSARAAQICEDSRRQIRRAFCPTGPAERPRRQRRELLWTLRRRKSGGVRLAKALCLALSITPATATSQQVAVAIDDLPYVMPSRTSPQQGHQVVTRMNKAPTHQTLWRDAKRTGQFRSPFNPA